METQNNIQKIQTGCLIILTSIVAASALKMFSSVLIPFVLAIFISFCLRPLIELQMKWEKMPRGVAIGNTFIFGCILLAVFGLFVSATVVQVTENKDEYQQQLERSLNKAIELVDMERFGMSKAELKSYALNGVGNSAKRVLSGMVSGILNIVSNFILVLVFLVFMLCGKGDVEHKAAETWDKIQYNIKRYIITLLITSGLTGSLVGLTLFLLGVKFAWMFGFLAFFLNFIPNIGSIIATMLPLPVILLSPDLTVGAKGLAVIIPGLIQFTIGNIVQPKMMGTSLDLHPVTVLLSLIFFGAIWGIVGMFLATPIIVCIKIFLDKIDYTRPMADMMAGRF